MGAAKDPRILEIAKIGYEEGRTASQVAMDVFEATGDVITRSAVCGHWYRMGLRGRNATKPIKRPDSIPALPRPDRIARLPPAAFPVAAPTPNNGPGPILHRHAEPPPTGVLIMEKHAKACSWPLWRDKERPDAHSSRYCGEPVEHEKASYCRFHRLKSRGTSIWQG